MATWIALISCGVATWTDLRTGKIPNLLTGCAGLCGIGLSIWSASESDIGGGSLVQTLWGIAWPLLIILIPLGLMSGQDAETPAIGGGDLKLATVIGICLGPWGLLTVLFVAGICAAPILAIAGRGMPNAIPMTSPVDPSSGSPIVISRVADSRASIPLAPFFTLGVMATVVVESFVGAMP